MAKKSGPENLNSTLQVEFTRGWIHGKIMKLFLDSGLTRHELEWRMGRSAHYLLDIEAHDFMSQYLRIDTLVSFLLALGIDITKMEEDDDDKRKIKI